jgi:Txe/YoeB family toxin of Txe-Axe toxin-antitoxin module
VSNELVKMSEMYGVGERRKEGKGEPERLKNLLRGCYYRR